MNKNLCFVIMAVCTSAASAAESPVQIVKSYMAAWNHHNAQQAADYFSPEGVYYDASVGTPVTGKSAAEQQVIAPFIQGSLICNGKWWENPSGIKLLCPLNGYFQGTIPATGLAVRQLARRFSSPVFLLSN